MALQRILVPIDGSEPSRAALDFGVALANACGAAIEVVTVVDLGQLDYYDGMYRSIPQLEAWQADIKRGILDAACETIPEDGPDWTSRLMRGPAVRTLLKHIETTRPDMVVVGRTGRGALDRALHGSVSRRLCARAQVPVTVVS